MLIVAETKIRDALRAHPQLKPILIGLNPKFKRLDNPALFETVGRFARMKDVARIGGLTLCELLYPLNEALGQLDPMAARFPDCLHELRRTIPPAALAPPKEDVSAPAGFPVFDPPDVELPAWWESRESFEQLNLIGLEEDPFELLLGKAHSLDAGQGFAIQQAFRPEPLIDVLDALDFEAVVEQLAPARYRVWFCKQRSTEVAPRADHRVGVVLQSATPVVWPVLKRLLQSERLKARIRFDEVKVWDKTEKHLGWMVKEKADVSFSAVVAATRLYAGGLDIKLAGVDVWDNFYLLSRGAPVKTLADLRGRTLRMPLVRNAPPCAVTCHLLKANGLDPDEFSFAFGKPFGRPDELRAGFVAGEYDTVLLREPEASFALHGAGAEANEPLSFARLWAEVHGADAILPNAGLVFKGQFLRAHPAEARLIMDELGAAIRWVNEHPAEAASLVVQEMGQERSAIELFLSRATLRHVPAHQARGAVERYLQVLLSEKGLQHLRADGLERGMGILDLEGIAGFDNAGLAGTDPQETSTEDNGKITAAIGAVEHPEISMSLVDLGMVRDIQVADDHVTMALVIPFLGIPDVVKNFMTDSLTKATEQAGGKVDEIRIETMTDEERQRFFSQEQSHWRS